MSLVVTDKLQYSATVTITENQVIVMLDKHAHNPYLIASGLANTPTPMPWFGNKKLAITFAWNAVKLQNRRCPRGCVGFSLGAALSQAARAFQARLRLRRLAQSENRCNHCKVYFLTGPKRCAWRLAGVHGSAMPRCRWETPRHTTSTPPPNRSSNAATFLAPAAMMFSRTLVAPHAGAWIETCRFLPGGRKGSEIPLHDDKLVIVVDQSPPHQREHTPA